MDRPAGTRITFRELEPGDLASVRTMFADDYARRFYPAYQDDAAALRWIEWNRGNYREFGFGLWAILDQSGSFVGDCGLTWQNSDKGRQLEIGYHVTENRRGSGYALEAARAVLAWAWAHTGEDEIVSIVAPDNLASIKTAEKLHQYRREYSKADGSRRLLFYTLR